MLTLRVIRCNSSMCPKKLIDHKHILENIMRDLTPLLLYHISNKKWSYALESFSPQLDYPSPRVCIVDIIHINLHIACMHLFTHGHMPNFVNVILDVLFFILSWYHG